LCRKENILFDNSNVIDAVSLGPRVSAASSCVIAEADDGCKYVVKWMEDRPGTRIALREAFGTSVFAALGILVPAWRPIHISDRLIEADECKCLDRLDTRTKILPGIHFGSRCVGGGGERVYEVIPDNWHQCIRNRADFWGSLVLDLWLNSSQPRQSLLITDKDDLEVWTLFVSHSGISFDPYEKVASPLNACFHPDLRVYPQNNVMSSIDYWIDRIRLNGEEAVINVLATLPSAWTTVSSGELGGRVIDRISTLGERVYGALCAEMKGNSTKAVRSVQASRLHPVGCSALGR